MIHHNADSFRDQRWRKIPSGPRREWDPGMETTQHFGIYGLWRDQGRLVLVRKSRGPYTGLLDLPGGSPEPGETTAETLARELREETGARLFSSSMPRSFDIHVTADSKGCAIDLRHRGRIVEVQVEGDLRHDIDDEDVNGIVLAAGRTIDQLSLLAVEALQQFPSYAPLTLLDDGAATFDAQADAAYFSLVSHIGHGEAVENTVIERPGGTIILDVDADGRLLGVEVVGARTLLRDSTLEGLELLG
ncbi:NUDIX domain-containing protein [Brachybacterium sacelli]